MEKILRKVKITERPPNKFRVLVESKQNYLFEIFYYDNTFNQTQFPSDKQSVDINLLEYWYEEVDLDDIIAVEKQKYLTELANDYKEVMPDDLQQHLAKERYEKALNSMGESHWTAQIQDFEDLCEILKIAAGFQDSFCDNCGGLNGCHEVDCVNLKHPMK
jgi:hypothetical protein